MFIDFPLREPVARALEVKGFTTQTAIQNATLPHALAGGDVLGMARTGTGKTLAFGLPILVLLVFAVLEWRARRRERDRET